MKKTSFNQTLNIQKEKLTTELLYLRNKHKGFTKDFIEFLVNQNQDTAIKLLNQSKSKEDFHKLVKENYHQLVNKYGYIFECLITGKLYDNYNPGLSFLNPKETELFLNSNYKKSDFKRIIEEYANILTTYINNTKVLKHKLLPIEYVNGNPIIDYKKDITEEYFKELCESLFIENTVSDDLPKSDLSSFIVMLLSVYDKDTLLNNKDMVTFELEYGYFDIYCELLYGKKDFPSLEQRRLIYENEKDITSEQHYHLNNIELLESRVTSLNSDFKYVILEKIKIAKEEATLKKKASLIDECFEFYENAYRQEIVSALYSPSSSIEVNDFRQLDVVMLHKFIRDPMIKLRQYRETLKKEIIGKRGVKVESEESLTKEECEIYQSKLDYAINVLLNPVITSTSLESDSIYSDSTGFRWYRSNTSNQISASVFSVETLLNQANCIGVGFDNSSISPENIIISSNVYQTTNMGVDNLEVSQSHQFKTFSAPLSELSKSKKTEVVMYRKRGDKETNSAYVFAIINGRNEKNDQETIEQARDYAEKNKIKLVVFNNYKIKKSYDEFLSQHNSVEEIAETEKKL